MAGGFGATSVGGLVGGFNDESTKIRQANTQQAEQEAQRNSKVFDALANSDDPQIRAAAVTGLLTGNHPADAMGKWFGKVQQHPAYDQISQLVNEGHQPFMNPTDRKAAELDSEIKGVSKTAADLHAPLSPDDTRRMILGKIGAPPPRPMMKQYGTIMHSDGTSEAGSFDPNDNQYYDQYGSPANDLKEFRHGGLAAEHPASGGNWSTIKDSASPTGWSKVHVDAAGKELGREQGASAPSPESFSPVVTPAGVQKFGNKSGTVTPAPGGAGVGHAEPASAGLTSAKEVEASILKAAGPRPTALAPGLSVDPKKTQAWLADVDKAAQRYGYKDYADVQQKIGEAGRGVQSSVVGSAPPAVPPAAGAKKGGTPPAKGKKPGGIDGSAVLDYLKKFDKQ